MAFESQHPLDILRLGVLVGHDICITQRDISLRITPYRTIIRQLTNIDWSVQLLQDPVYCIPSSAETSVLRHIQPGLDSNPIRLHPWVWLLFVQLSRRLACLLAWLTISGRVVYLLDLLGLGSLCLILRLLYVSWTFS